MTIEIVANLSQDAVSGERKSHSVQIVGQRPQPGDCNDGKRGDCECRVCIKRGQMRDFQAVSVMLRDDYMIKDELERPWFDETERDLREQRYERRADHCLLLAHVGPEAAEYLPQGR